MPIKMFDIQSNERDELGNQVLRFDLTALRSDPRLLDQLAGGFGVDHLTYRVSRNEHEKTGRFERSDPSFQVVFERNVDPDGVWTVSVNAQTSPERKPREIWHQHVFIQKNLRRSAEQVHELARKYAPIFLFSGGERYFPVSLETLFHSPLIQNCTETIKLDTVQGEMEIPLAELGDFMRFNGHSEYLIDFNMFSMKNSIFATMGGDPWATTVYFSYLEDPQSDRFFITYHLIYAFDTKAGLARLTGIGPHVFDRESMVLVFEEEEPTALVISGHLENQKIFFLDKLKIWTQGRIRVEFQDPHTVTLGNHPLIAVAEGSHALYPTSGVYQLSLLKELAGFVDPRITGHQPSDSNQLRPEQVALPPSMRSPTVPSYRLLPLGLDRLSSRIDPGATDYDGYNAYLAFSGFWVDVPGTQNARFPPFTRKMAEIEAWVDKAYQWQWDDLPKNLGENNQIILEFLQENIEDF